MHKILYVVNSSKFFCSHFLNLACSMKEKGFDVQVLCGDEDYNSKKLILSKGICFSSFPLKRKGKNPFQEIITIFRVYRKIKEINPDIIHSFTIKPIIYLGVIHRIFFRKFLHVCSVTGLGSSYLSSSMSGKFVWGIIRRFYYYSFSLMNVRVVFENKDDLSLFCEQGISSYSQSFLVNGAGVDTNYYTPSFVNNKKVTVSLVCRLLKDKGVLEFIEAGKIIKSKNLNIELQLIGDVDVENPTSLDLKFVEDCNDKGYIKYLGYSNNIKKIYQLSDIACLPSYREGLPKSLIEASSCGLPIITTDVPGCRHVVEHGVNGLLVPAKNAQSLCKAIEELSSDSRLLETMGMESRKLAVSKYDHVAVNQSFFDIYSSFEEIR